jgi:hypothetical protein
MTHSDPSPGGLPAPRLLAAWGLLAYAALFLFFEVVKLMLPGGSFADRAAGADFRSLLIMAMPVLAVLLAVYVSPSLSSARIIAAIAIVEYGVSLFFGLVTLLIGVISVIGGINNAQSAFGALRFVVMAVAELLLIAIAGLVAYRGFTTVGGRIPSTGKSAQAA